jgi:hypothetical protein
MALKDNASLALIPAAYKTSKIYSAIPTDGDGDFTFTRSGNATRVNKAGLVETMGANIGRLNYDLTNGTPASCPSLLLEPSRQNKVFPNNSLTGYSTIGVTTSNNQTTAPNGANEGAEVQATTSGTAVVFKGFIGTSGVTHNISAFIKAGTHNQVRLQEGFSASNIDVNLSNGNIIANSNSSNLKVEEYPNNWYRVSFNFTSSGTNLQFALYFNGSYSSGENVYLYGGQIEEGAYSTSIIPTSGLAVTRTADTAKIDNFSNAPTDYPFTIFCDFDLVKTGQKSFMFSFLWLASSSNYFTVGYNVDGAGNFFKFENRAQGSVEGVKTTSTYTEGRYKLAIKFVSSTNFKAFIDGVEVADHTHTAISFNSAISDFLLGQLRVSGDTGDRTPIHQFMLFNEALSDSELQALTT